MAVNAFQTMREQDMQLTVRQLGVIQTLFDAAERRGILLWLESGWAIDARLGRVTREHEDIDIAFAGEQKEAYRQLLEELGFVKHEAMDYGFLSWYNDVLLDSEPCLYIQGEYNFADFPRGSCPLQKEGMVENYPIRCLSWEALYFEFLGYMHEVARERWRSKDFQSLRIIEEHLSERRKRELQEIYLRTTET